MKPVVIEHVASRKPLKIFLFEDETGFHPRSQMLTALAGHTITLAKNKTEGLKLYSPPYDLLLLDFDVHGNYGHKEMPECGYQFLKALFKLKYAHRNPRVILHSQNTQGRKDMRGLLEEHGLERIEDHPFSDAFVQFLRKEFSL